MATARRIWMLAAITVAASSAAFGYAHRIFFSSRSAPFNPVPAGFSLPNNTVSYFISDQPPSPLMPGDSFSNIVSQIQAAANVWNRVPTSTIRVNFGGLSNIGATQQSAPGIDVTFNDDVPPGLLAFTTMTLPADLSSVGTGAVVPILRSTITMRRNLTTPNPLASYDDLFFMMTVHEFGHALGLQHTLTSGVMATAITSATTKAAPLSPDDVAAISLLYPAQGYGQSTGTVSGTVLVGGSPVNMANVVALSQNGTAISTLSNPDGSFQIQGVPPGQYYVYASPLPPAQTGESYPDNIYPAEDSQGNPFPANTGFDTEFFPGTRDVTQAALVPVSAGQVSPNVSFNLQQRSSPAISYLVTYTSGAYGGTVYSPALYPGSWKMVLQGPGIISQGGLAAGLSVTAIGAATVEPKSLSYYQGSGLITVDIGQVQAGPATPVALVATLPNDMYVLPYAFSVVSDAPPWITGVSGTTDAFGSTTVNITGSNLNSSTAVTFDGVPAPVISANSDGSLTVAAPAAPAGYTAYVEALSNDGQTSWQDLGTTVPATFAYGGIAGAAAVAGPSIVVNSGLLLPGATAMLDVIGTNTSCATGQASVGLGSSDITVGRVWVLTPHVLANVTVSPQAKPGLVDLTVTCGLQSMTLKSILQVQAPGANLMTMMSPIVNQATGLPGTPAGGVALIPTSGIPQSLAGWTLYVDNIASTFQMGGGNFISVQLPSGLPLGPAIVQLVSPNSSVTIPPVVMQIDAPPPLISAVVDGATTFLSASTPVHIGDTLTVSVAQLTQSSNGSGLANTQVTIGGLLQSAVVTPITILGGPVPDSYQIQFTVGSNVPYGPSDWLTVAIGTRVSAHFNLSILPPQ